MKPLFFLIAGFALAVSAYAQELTADEQASLAQLESDYAKDPNNASLQHAWLLYRTGIASNIARANAVLDQAIALQDDDPDSLTYGQWNWRWEGGEKRADLNAALFKADLMFAKLWEQQEHMPAETRAHFLASCRRLTEAAVRRWNTEVFDINRDFTAYSNIFVLYVETLTLAGARFGDVRLQKTAKSQWTRWHNHITFFGIDEFASPGYNDVIFRHLMNIHQFCNDERIRREVEEVLDHIFLLQSALTHPRFKMPVSGISRDYRTFLMEEDARSGVLKTPLEGYEAPRKALEINAARSYPFEVIGKASIVPFIFKSYQLADAAMGSMTGGHCFQQQIHCMAVTGASAAERAVLFAQGSNTPINGFTDQIGMATLCVYNRLPNYWHLTQWRGDMTQYRETIGEFGVGLSAGWRETRHTPSHIVLEAYGHDAHLFPFAVDNERLAPCELTLKHRTTTSPRYHPRPRIFDEYVFPPEPDWFGVHIVLAASGTDVADPGITYAEEDGLMVFRTNTGHQVRLVVAEMGDTRQLYNVDPALIPRLKISE